MKNFKEVLWVAGGFALVVLVCVLLVSFFPGKKLSLFDEPPPPTPEQQVLIDQMKYVDDLRKKGDCSDQEILIGIGNITLKVSRKDIMATKSNGVNINSQLIRYDCDIKELKDISRLVVPISGLTKQVIDLELSTKISNKHLINRSRLSAAELVRIGVDSLRGDARYYELPLRNSPTGNDESVIFECGAISPDNITSNCKVSYLSPKGLRIRYMFFRKDVTASEYINFDKKMRDEFESMIVKEGNKNGL
jgi:hypothetical protein